MLRISGLKLQIPHGEDALLQAITKKAKGKKTRSYRIVRRSIDARKKPTLFYIYSIDASFDNEKKILQGKGSQWTKVEEKPYHFPVTYKENDGKTSRPVIVGAGPAGLFATLMLARAGWKPILLERGDCVEVRTEKVEELFAGGKLDTESNVQFGEGGAGTFSDGKLNTLVKDKFGRNHFVLQEFVKHGAPEAILYDAKPHIGTDVLKDVVISIRQEILSLGGVVHFRTKMTDIIKNKNNVTGIVCEKEGDRFEIPCEALILALGHSARDSFTTLYERGIHMTPKAFAIGVRVEHPAQMINESMYGEGYPEELSAASYKLTHQCKNGRGIYSFCMCPGGYVVNSSSEEGRLCVNGMSYSGRDGKNSNTALITTVTPEDFPSDHPLAGMEFQRKYEEAAFALKQGKIPVQLYKDFKENVPSTQLGEIEPQIKGQWDFANLWDCLPDYVCESLLEGMEAFGHTIRGYDREDTIFAGVETRTSSPVRMDRDDGYQCNLEGVFPCGEGAGYAGGITSAAMDGIKVAEAVAMYLLKERR
ncbi:MAG: FAD-dependent oxidoreductase [Eubacteriales bacterium]|nr:FAD-dependent oxidoreductase [Eubacteriales bacterium]